MDNQGCAGSYQKNDRKFKDWSGLPGIDENDSEWFNFHMGLQKYKAMVQYYHELKD